MYIDCKAVVLLLLLKHCLLLFYGILNCFATFSLFYVSVEDSKGLRNSRHFWLRNVCRNKGMRDSRLGSKSSFTTCTTIEELMSEAITSDSIRTYGMSQSDKKNNSVNRLQATTSTRRRKRSKTSASSNLSSFSQIQHDEEIPIANPFPHPTIQILSNPITHVPKNGRLSLDCVVREDPPNNVWWWVNGTKLDLAHHRGGVYIEKIKQEKSCTSKLIVDNFSHVDEGTYECRSEKLDLPQLTQTSSVSVTVIDPTEAPMFSENGNGNSGSQRVTLQSFFIIVLTLVLI